MYKKYVNTCRDRLLIMKCLFCKTEINNINKSDEHIIPKFLGGNYVIYNVCKNCNSKMGECFERELSQNMVIKFFQAFYHMKNRSGKFIVPNLELKCDENMHITSDDEGHIFMHTHLNINDDENGTITIKIDQSEPTEKLEEIINTKISRLEKKYGGKNLSYEIKRNEKKLIHGVPTDVSINIDNNILIKLFVKIAHEFSCIYLGSKYFDSDIAERFRKILFDDEDCLILNELSIKLSYDERQARFCVYKVKEIANENTHNIHYGNKLIYPSNGNYIHKISLINKQGKIFVNIDLFGILHAEICVSDNERTYEFEKGDIIKLIIGVCDEKPFKKIITNYEELKNI